MSEPFPTAQTEGSGQWVSISDLMSGLMIVFLMVAVFYMIRMNEEKQEVEDVAKVYWNTRASLSKALEEAFKDDFPRWQAEYRPESLSVRFKAPDVLFAENDTTVTQAFQEILNDFFPRYTAILNHPSFRDHIAEVRIEGHTSTSWTNRTADEEVKYLGNMNLSQRRTLAVLKYILSLSEMAKYKKWLRPRLTANGLSYSKLLCVHGERRTEVCRDDEEAAILEDETASRRVEFKVRTDAEEQMARILRKIHRQRDASL